MRLLFLVLLIFLGCSNKEVKPPKWLYGIYDNKNYLFAASQAYDRETAIKNALSQIASKLSVKVSSETITNKGIINNRYYKDFYKYVNTKVTNIPITNYQVIKESKDDVYYYVLIRVNKSLLAQSYKQIIDSKLSTIYNLINRGEGFNRIINVYKALKILKESENLIQIYNLLSYDNKYQAELVELKKKISNILTTYTFYIDTNNHAFKIVTQSVFSNYITIGNKYPIYLTIKIKKDYLLEQYIITGVATINATNRILMVKFIGKSYKDYNEAMKNALYNYEIKLNKKLKEILLKD